MQNNQNPLPIPAQLPNKFDMVMALVALMHAGNLMLEFKDENGKVVKRLPMARCSTSEDGTVLVQMPMQFVKSLMNSDFELRAYAMRPNTALDDATDILFIECKKKETQSIVTDLQLPKEEIRKITREALRLKQKLN